MNIDLSTDTPPSPERTLQLAKLIAGAVVALNHTTRHHEAFGSPGDTDRFLRDLALAIGGIPQLLEQAHRWVADEAAEGRIGIPSGEWAGRPVTAVTALRIRLDAAREAADDLSAGLEHAARVTSALAGREDDDDG